MVNNETKQKLDKTKDMTDSHFITLKKKLNVIKQKEKKNPKSSHLLSFLDQQLELELVSYCPNENAKDEL